MNTENNIPNELTEKHFENIKYQDLKAEFERLGLKSVFKGGKKTEDLIKEAIKQFKILKSLQSEGSLEEDIEAQIELINIEQEKENQAEAIRQQLLEEENKEKELNQVKEKKYSKDVLEKNLSVIDSNLKLGIPSQRLILLKKREQIQALLQEFE